MLKKTISIPLRTVGPVKIIGDLLNQEVKVPLATYESPLWPSVNRGARLSRNTDGIRVSITNEKMTRSIILQGSNASYLLILKRYLEEGLLDLQVVVSKTSRFAKIINTHSQIIGNLIYIRFEFTTGDAAGHNMATKAADCLIEHICSKYPDVKYISISGNICTDKKVSAINSILGRGKSVVAEILIPRDLCEAMLKTTPEKIVELNIKKNFIGSIIAGSVCSANAHFANILLAFYLAMGQDGANIVEGSQGISFAEVKDDMLYFSVTCPNIIVGTVGSGKNFDFVKNHLELMGCLDQSSPIGEQARRLAGIAVATVLCSELSLLAAQTNRGELSRVHEQLERIN